MDQQTKSELVDVDGLRSSGIWQTPPSARTIHRWVKDGFLPSYKIGRARLFDPREIAVMLRRKFRIAAVHE